MCQPSTSSSYEASSDDTDCCWICLGEGGMLSRPCMCPRSVHPTCLARWQLQQAGRKEERSCRFCNASLPDWKVQLAPAPPTPVEPVMVVSLGGKAVKMRVKPGPEGMSQFRQQVRELFNIPADVDFECSFKCKAPSGDTIQLDGLASYEAATHCASLMAAQRAAAAARRAASAAVASASSPHQQQQQHHHHHQQQQQHLQQQPQQPLEVGPQGPTQPLTQFHALQHAHAHQGPHLHALQPQHPQHLPSSPAVAHSRPRPHPHMCHQQIPV